MCMFFFMKLEGSWKMATNGLGRGPSQNTVGA